jgi:hypothetical protein
MFKMTEDHGDQFWDLPHSGGCQFFQIVLMGVILVRLKSGRLASSEIESSIRLFGRGGDVVVYGL